MYLAAVVVGISTFSVTAQAQDVLSETIWSIEAAAADDESAWFRNDNNTRGIAYNKATGNLLVHTRTAGERIVILDPATGDSLGQMNLEGVSGGFWRSNLIDVSPDGRVFSVGLFLAGAETMRLYSWASETAEPKLIYEGDLNGNKADLRYGDSFRADFTDGASTLYVGGSGNPNLAKFTYDAVNDTVSAVEVFNFGAVNNPVLRAVRGMAPIAGQDSIWVNEFDYELRKMSTQTGELGALVPDTVFPTKESLWVDYAVVDDIRLAAVFPSNLTATGQSASIIDLNTGAEIAYTAAGPNGNGNGAGGPVFDVENNRMFLLATNNQIAAYDISAYLSGPTARLQVIHNAADPAAASVDIYVNGDLLLDDFTFRAATPFIDVPAGVELSIAVAPPTSTSVDDAIATFPVTLADGETYVVFANGVLNPDNFAANPGELSIGFSLYPVAGAREAAENTDNVEFFVFHGATDAPAVDVLAGEAKLVDGAAYGDATGYLSVPPASYILDITPAGANETIVATFEADLSGLAGGTAVVAASGFLTPSANQDGPAFTLIAVLADGTVIELPAYEAVETFSVTFNVDMSPATNFNPSTQEVYVSGSFVSWNEPGSNPDARMVPVEAGSDIYSVTFDLEVGEYSYKYFFVNSGSTGWDNDEWPGDPNRIVNVTGDVTVNDTWGVQPTDPVARLQVIHNAADPAAASVDIYVNGDLLLDDFAFRAATPFIDVPAGVELSIAVAPPTSTSVDDAIATFPVTLDDGETYVVFANGVLNPDNFTANPGELSIGFSLYPVAGAREAAENTDNVEFFVFHGATDAPAVDVLAGDAKLVDGAAYGDATGYLSVPAGVYSLDITPAGANETIVATFTVDLAGAAGASAVAFASGFLNPAANGDGEAFALALALADGTVLVVTPTSNGREFSDLPVTFALEQNYPNPFNPTTNINYSLPEASDVTLSVYNIQGQRVATLVNNRIEAGRHTVSFDGNGLASGLYLYRITAGGFSQTAKMMLIK